MSSEKAPAPASKIDPKAQELLDHAIEALGGPAFLRVKSLRTAGRIFAISEGVTSGFAPFESTVEFPDKRRFSYGKDKPVVLINNGERGWQIDKYGMIRQPSEQIRRWRVATRYSLENLLRELIHEPGVLIQDGGVDFIENLPVRAVDIVDAKQVRIRLYLHRTSCLPLRISYRIQNPASHEWEEYAEVYADYRKIQDVQTPRHITRYLNGERYSEIFRNSAQWDPSIPANYFQPGG